MFIMAAITYIFDYTGEFVQNLVKSEVHNLTEGNFRDFYYVVPKYSPFFTNNFSIVYKKEDGSTRTLVENVDYYMALPFYGATRSIGIPVYGAVAFDPTLTNGSVSITYQTVGGEWVSNADDVYTRLASIAYNPRIVTFEQVSGVPSVFPPINHNQSLTSIVGQEGLIAAIEDVTNAISNKVIDCRSDLEIIKQEILNYVDDKLLQCTGTLIMAGGLLGKNTSVANTNVLVAQINSGVDYVLATLNMVNTATTDALVSVAVSSSTVVSQADYILYNLPLKANNSVIRSCLILNPSEYVYLISDTSGVVGRLYGIEQNSTGTVTPVPTPTISVSWSPSTCPQGTQHTLTITNATPNATVTYTYSQLDTNGSVLNTSNVTTLGTTDGSGSFTYNGTCSWVSGAVSGVLKTYVNGSIVDTSNIMLATQQ